MWPVGVGLVVRKRGGRMMVARIVDPKVRQGGGSLRWRQVRSLLWMKAKKKEQDGARRSLELCFSTLPLEPESPTLALLGAVKEDKVLRYIYYQ